MAKKKAPAAPTDVALGFEGAHQALAILKRYSAPRFANTVDKDRCIQALAGIRIPVAAAPDDTPDE